KEFPRSRRVFSSKTHLELTLYPWIGSPGAAKTYPRVGEGNLPRAAKRDGGSHDDESATAHDRGASQPDVSRPRELQALQRVHRGRALHNLGNSALDDARHRRFGTGGRHRVARATHKAGGGLRAVSPHGRRTPHASDVRGVCLFVDADRVWKRA